MTDVDAKDLRRTLLKQRKALTRLTDVLLVALRDFDGMLQHRQDIPRELSSSLGKWASFLEAENDTVRYFALGVDYRTDNKSRADKASRKRLKLPSPRMETAQ